MALKLKMIKRGLNLSASLPAMMDIKPLHNTETENAPDVSARVQPNCSDTGLKKTPKLDITRPSDSNTRKVPITIVYLWGISFPSAFDDNKLFSFFINSYLSDYTYFNNFWAMPLSPQEQNQNLIVDCNISNNQFQ